MQLGQERKDEKDNFDARCNQAIALLKKCYDAAEPKSQDVEKAVATLIDIADKGFTKARGELVQCIQEKHSSENQKTTQLIIYYLSEKAEKEEVQTAQISLAYLYTKGTGVDQSDEKTVALYTKAAERGDSSSRYEAQYWLGTWFLSGNSAEEKSKGVEYLTKAAAKNHLPAYVELNRFFAGYYNNPSRNPYLAFLYNQWLFKLETKINIAIKESYNAKIRDNILKLRQEIINLNKKLKDETIIHSINNVIKAINYGAPKNWHTDIELLAALIKAAADLEQTLKQLPQIPSEKGWFKTDDRTRALKIIENINVFFSKITRIICYFLLIDANEFTFKPLLDFYGKESTDKPSQSNRAKALIIALAKIIEEKNLFKITIIIDKNLNLEDIKFLFNFISPSCTELHLQGESDKFSIKDLSPIFFSLIPRISTINLSKLILPHADRNEEIKAMRQVAQQVKHLTYRDAAEQYGHTMVLEYQRAGRPFIILEEGSGRTIILPDNEWSKTLIKMFHQHVTETEDKEKNRSITSTLEPFRQVGLNCDYSVLRLICQYSDHGSVTLQLEKSLDRPLLAAPAIAEQKGAEKQPVSPSESSEQKETKREHFNSPLGTAVAVASLKPLNQSGNAVPACAAETPVIIVDVASSEAQEFKLR